MEANYHNIQTDDMLNGDGLRVTLFVSGCEHHCFKCHNQQTWDIHSGIQFDVDALCEIIEWLRKDHISGLTLSGGDPLHPANRELTSKLTHLTHQLGKNVWVYTGYLFEDIPGHLLKNIDILVDGPYIEELRSPDLPWVGSSNQRIIDVQKSLEKGEIVIHYTQEDNPA